MSSVVAVTRADWVVNVKYWSTLEAASYLGVSASWLRKKIREGTVAAVKAGPFEWPRRECYYIKRREVMRVLKEVPLPPTGETLADRLERGRDRLYRYMGMDTRSEVKRFLNLDRRSDDELLIKWLLGVTSHRPRPRTKKPQ